MTDDPISQDEIPTDSPVSDDWTMPEPIFRSSPGRNPREPEDDTLVANKPDGTEHETLPANKPNGPSEDISKAITDEMPAYPAKGSLFTSFFFILVMIALLGLAIIGALYYVLTLRRPDTTF